MSAQLAVLRCPACAAAALKPGNGKLACGACGETVPTEQGIPILARQWSAVAADVEAAKLVRPGWYLEEQPPEQTSPWRHHLRKRRLYIERVVARHLHQLGRTRVPRLLDLGCGDGNNLVWLSKYAEMTYGSDYNLVRLVRSKAQNPTAEIFAADILDFPSVDDAFDIIFFNHVIEHMPDDRSALASARRILNPGGLLIIGTPNEGAWWWQWAYKRDPKMLAETDHCQFYTAQTIGDKIKDAGLTLTETHHMGWGPPDWRLDGRIRRYKILDDLFSVVGRALIPKQASSLYLLATKSTRG